MSQPVVSPVYDSTTTEAHLIEGVSHPASHDAALCGVTPAWPNYWFGAGSPVERVIATEKKICAACTTKWKEME